MEKILYFNKEEVLEAIKNDEYALKYASEELRNNPEVMLETLKNTKYAYDIFASTVGDKLKENEEFVQKVVLMTKKIYTGGTDEKDIDVEEIKEGKKDIIEEKINNFAKENFEIVSAHTPYPDFDDAAYAEFQTKYDTYEKIELFEKVYNKMKQKTDNSKDEKLEDLMKKDEKADNLLKLAENVIAKLKNKNHKEL